MKTSQRLESAIKKLYTAFHNNELHPECCKQCAVGNILDNTDSWKHLSDEHGALELNYIGNVHQMLGRKFNGYSPLELLHIEARFLKACGYQLPLHHKNKKPKNPTDNDVLFEGLTAVVTYLCKLDNIPNVMDYTKLFEVKNEEFHFQLV
ncbi:MAG: Na(+)-translocating NADH-quinone reductase subunit F [Flavobacteriales bacterium]|nr:Na(+)-translocating NADH-quinone reductase subunit F [Flavobacteriales bacterium]PIY10208.1 MAG: Na(+)-translocating NADH-quinone reductase subunit F [Flavobacteriaceae bacterium CG_4_10_14_3_um_filter_33_47]PJB18238.1 MAG: Na(+)-translocating NADH-quinone reductase subunit F [Flavobacteriaceae bacterium CG_4_9_14_3_um_filter_33_16]NCP59851.1 Na(+)-translocating NADH-quinone reductase subunit F [Flavobacteriales bacterium]NCQ58100.1 Na(+)-translocating NADH-quinone reductase subunit F [Flavo